MASAIMLIDGALGTVLGERGLPTDGPLFSAVALLDARGLSLLQQVHREYLRAGAGVITAATFRTNPRALDRQGLGDRFHELVRAAVREARAAVAAESAPALVAGSIAPVEDCYRPDLRPPVGEARREHQQHARALAEAGCDLLLVETVAAADEGLAALEAALATGLPAWVSAQASPRGALPDGSDLRAFMAAAAARGAGALLLNCTPCEGIDAALGALQGHGPPSGAYAQIGEMDDASGWASSATLSPLDYAQRAARWAARGATLIGGCCGTTPAHIEALRARLAP
jgi:S-methylmethionine-dependent homocysteine/selenocysteine methylase